MLYPFGTLPDPFRVRPFSPAQTQTRPTPTTAQLERTLSETMNLLSKLANRHYELHQRVKRLERAHEERSVRDTQLDSEFNTLQHSVDSNAAAISTEQKARIYAIKDLQEQVDKLRAEPQEISTECDNPGSKFKLIVDKFGIVAGGNLVVDNHGMIQDTINLDTSIDTRHLHRAKPTIEDMLRQLQEGADVLHDKIGVEDPDERIFDLANARWHMLQAMHLLKKTPTT